MIHSQKDFITDTFSNKAQAYDAGFTYVDTLSNLSDSNILNKPFGVDWNESARSCVLASDSLTASACFNMSFPASVNDNARVELLSNLIPKLFSKIFICFDKGERSMFLAPAAFAKEACCTTSKKDPALLTCPLQLIF